MMAGPCGAGGTVLLCEVEVAAVGHSSAEPYGTTAGTVN